MKVYDSLSTAYLETLKDVYNNPDCVSSPRDLVVKEKFNYQFSINNPKVEYIKTFDEARNKVIEDYSKKEFDIYQSCSNKAEDFGKISKYWLKLANPDGTINSAYGHLIWNKKSHGNDFEIEHVYHEALGVTLIKPVRRTPWEWCIESLRTDKDTRQAILRFSLPEHQYVGNKDQTCTLHGIFMIRNNKLNLSINMRSNDLVLGLVYDLPWFVSLMYKMQKDLKDVYKDLEIGQYTHYVHNIHVYQKDENRILQMLGENERT